MCVCVVFFFCQAEDGIRDLVRSRGLGDVYKRQAQSITYSEAYLDKYPKGKYSKEISGLLLSLKQKAEETFWQSIATDPVSYTHLTLPTSDLV